ncbi:XkdX family protein [Companilactobacillus sp. DQM5]
MFEYIKSYFEMGLYSESDLDTFVSSGMITEEEKQEILKEKSK